MAVARGGDLRRAGATAALAALCAGLLSLGACGAGPAPAALARPVPEVEAPVELASLHETLFIVRATTGPGVELALLVDTGAETTILDRARAEAHGLAVRPLAGGRTMTGADGNTVPVTHAVALDGLRLEGALGGAVTIGAFDALAVDLGSVPLDIDGLLAWDALVHLAVVFDPERDRMHVVGVGAGEEDVVDYLGRSGRWPTEWQRLELTPGDRPMTTIEPSGGTEIRLLLDTGATGTSLPEATIAELGLEPIGTVRSGTATGELETARYRLGELDLGEWSVTCDVAASPRPYGKLGLNVLGEFVFVVEGPERALWLAPRAE